LVTAVLNLRVGTPNEKIGSASALARFIVGGVKQHRLPSIRSGFGVGSSGFFVESIVGSFVGSSFGILVGNIVGYLARSSSMDR